VSEAMRKRVSMSPRLRPAMVHDKDSRTSVHRRRIQKLVGAGLLVLAIYWFSSVIVRTFHWAEHKVDRDSYWHMFIFFAATLPFHTGLPIPIIHQAWAVAIGCFFRWKAFPILLASLSIGVPLPFAIGRRLALRYGGSSDVTSEKLRQISPRAASYLAPLRKAIAGRPIRTSFLLMWAPLPTSSLPLILGFIVPRQELRLRSFVAGALPSKLLHFACDVLVGLEAGSLATALDAHDDLPGVEDLDLKASRRHARLIAIGAMAMTVAFMAIMLYTMHQALREMRAKESSRECEDDASAPLLNVV
jgi:hypothetical protein